MNESLAQPEMTTGGWAFLALAWVTVGGLLVWSFLRVLGAPRPGPSPADDA